MHWSWPERPPPFLNYCSSLLLRHSLLEFNTAASRMTLSKYQSDPVSPQPRASCDSPSNGLHVGPTPRALSDLPTAATLASLIFWNNADTLLPQGP